MNDMILHNPKFNSLLVNREALAALPNPVSLGLRHKPVPHAVLVDFLTREVERRGYDITREQLALGAKGAALFGVLQLKVKHSEAVVAAERELALGFRNSVDQSVGISGVAGTRVFVCDNLALSGDVFAFRRKNTTGMDLASVIATGFDKFITHAQAFELALDRLANTAISDGDAKQIIYDIFIAGIVPLRLMDDVNRFYFTPTEDQTDCQPRTLYGLHNAFTRAMHDLTPIRMFSASVALGRAFHLTVEHLPGDVNPDSVVEAVLA